MARDFIPLQELTGTGATGPQTPPPDFMTLDEAVERGQRERPDLMRFVAEQPGRAASLLGEGTQQGLANAAGFLPALVARGLNATGLTDIDPAVYSRGAKQGMEWLGAQAMELLGEEPMAERPAPTNWAERAVYGAGRGIGDAAGFLMPAGALAGALRVGGAPQRVAASLAQQPAAQIASGAVGGAVGEAAENPWLGLAAAIATPTAINAAGRVVTPFPSPRPGEAGRLARTAVDEGINLTPGQITDSRPLQGIEAALQQLPFSSGMQRSLTATQRQQFNRAVLRRAGIDADEASPEVIGAAFARLSDEYDDIIRRTEVVLDDPFYVAIERIRAENLSQLPTDVRPIVESYIDDIGQATRQASDAGAERIVVSGENFQRVYSRLRARARRARSDPELQHALGELAAAFDDAMRRSIDDPALAARWSRVRREYRNLLVIDDAVGGAPQEALTSADVPFRRFAGAVRRSDPRGFGRGRGELNDLARVGALIAPRIPNSGTPERLQWMRTLSGAPPVLGGGAIASGIDPALAGAGMALSYSLPAAAHTIINSPLARAYLTNQLLTGTGPRTTRPLAAAVLAAQTPEVVPLGVSGGVR